jgi:hypothetical protein
MNGVTKLTLASIFVIFLQGCQTTSQYYWGSYENNLYLSFKQDGSISPEEQISKLNNDIDHALSKNLKVPPGLYLHLGYLYYQVGDFHASNESFLLEKSFFPDSSYFVDKLINQISK